MSTAATAKSPGQLFGLVFGAVYVLVGLLGFVGPLVTEGTGVDPDTLLGIFGINPLHNVAHLLVGALLLIGSRRATTAKTVNLVVGVVYLLLAILGFAGGVIVDDLINNNAADSVLHLATAVLAIYFGTAGSEVRMATA
jgi:hypothetical protein